jgi:hypothetical protein
VTLTIGGLNVRLTGKTHMGKTASDADVIAFMDSHEYREIVRKIKTEASQKKYALSPNDVPKVVLPIADDLLQDMFSEPFLKR